MVASVNNTNGEYIDNFGVDNEDVTKDYDLWGESNSKNWGDD